MIVYRCDRPGCGREGDRESEFRMAEITTYVSDAQAATLTRKVLLCKECWTTRTKLLFEADAKFWDDHKENA